MKTALMTTPMTTPMTTALTTTLMGTAQAAVLRLIAAPVDFPGEKVPDSAQINLIPNLGGVRLLRNLFHQKPQPFIRLGFSAVRKTCA